MFPKLAEHRQFEDILDPNIETNAIVILSLSYKKRD